MNRNFSFYFFSSGLSFLGANVFNYSVVLLAQKYSGNFTHSGFVYLALNLPFLFLSVIAGIALDTFSRRKIIFFSQILLSLASLSVSYLLAYGIIRLENIQFLFVSVILFGVGMSFIMPGRLAYLGNLVTKETIAKSAQLINILMLVTYGVAPILSGYFIHHYSYTAVFYFAAILIFCSFTILLFLPEGNFHKHQSDAGFSEIQPFLQKHKIILEFLFFCVVMMIGLGPIQIIYPEFCKTVLGLNDQQKGILIGLQGVGLLFGGLTILRFPNVKSGKSLVLSVLISSILFCILSVQSHLILSGILILLISYFFGIASTLLPSFLQRETDNYIRGRIMSIFSLLFLFTPALSGIACSFLLQRFGSTLSIYFVGVLVFCLSVYSVFFLKRCYRYKLN